MPGTENTVGQLAELVKGQVQGDGSTIVTGAAVLTDARQGDVTFVDGERYVRHIQTTPAAAVIVPENLNVDSVPESGPALIRVKDPLFAFINIVQQLKGSTDNRPTGIDSSAHVHSSAKLGPYCSVAPGAVIEEGVVLGARCRIYPGVVIGRNCKIGDEVTLHPNVVLYAETVLGNRVTIHANSTIGSDGFGYRMIDGKHQKIPQLGTVEIGDDVEIGANSAVDRATFGVTKIGQGTKIDNQVQVGHNCNIGEHNIFCGATAVAGSSTTGDYVVAAGQVGISDHVTVGAGVQIGAQSGVINDIPPGMKVWGLPAINSQDQVRHLVLVKKLPEIRKQLNEVRKQVEELRKTRKDAA